jgi:hypothetical protein
VFRGPVRDFVDLFLWISRDAAGAPDLAQLLALHAADPGLEDAVGSLSIGDADSAVSPVAAAGASAVLARTAGEILMSVTGLSLGLWRTCFLADERFGIGRHPAAGLHRGANFAVSLLITQSGVDGNCQ